MNQIAEQKLSQAARYLGENGIDLWLIYASEGSDPAVALLTGLKTIGRTFFFIGGDGKNRVLASVIDAQSYEESGLFDEVIQYSGDPAAQLRVELEKLPHDKIAIDFSTGDHLCDGLTTGRYRWLARTLGSEYEARFVSSEPMLSRIRAIKMPEEIAAMRRAIAIQDDIYAEVFAAIHPGMTEYQVGELFIKAMNSRGVVMSFTRDMSMPIIMKERISHRAPGEAVLTPGDYLIIDFGVLAEGYSSDFSRTLYMLKPGETKAPARFEEIFRATHGAITKAFEAARPGVEGWTVDMAAREHLRSRGMPELTHSTGHQIGTYAHDGGTMFAPKWEVYGKAPYGIIEEGMVLSLEPTVFLEDEYCALTEEEILITKDGAEFLTTRQNDIILIPAEK
ncbi:peptidase M24 [Clostridia bacterium]|nr:peptidase M24 [Clostridia bacterium]